MRVAVLLLLGATGALAEIEYGAGLTDEELEETSAQRSRRTVHNFDNEQILSKMKNYVSIKSQSRPHYIRNRNVVRRDLYEIPMPRRVVKSKYKLNVDANNIRRDRNKRETFSQTLPYQNTPQHMFRQQQQMKSCDCPKHSLAGGENEGGRITRYAPFYEVREAGAEPAGSAPVPSFQQMQAASEHYHRLHAAPAAPLPTHYLKPHVTFVSEPQNAQYPTETKTTHFAKQTPSSRENYVSDSTSSAVHTEKELPLTSAAPLNYDPYAFLEPVATFVTEPRLSSPSVQYSEAIVGAAASPKQYSKLQKYHEPATLEYKRESTTPEQYHKPGTSAKYREPTTPEYNHEPATPEEYSELTAPKKYRQLPTTNQYRQSDTPDKFRKPPKKYHEPAIPDQYHEPSTPEQPHEPATSEPYHEQATSALYHKPATPEQNRQPPTLEPIRKPPKKYHESATLEHNHDPTTPEQYRKSASPQKYQESATPERYREPATPEQNRDSAIQQQYHEPATPERHRDIPKIYHEPLTPEQFIEPATRKQFRVAPSPEQYGESAPSAQFRRSATPEQHSQQAAAPDQLGAAAGAGHQTKHGHQHAAGAGHSTHAGHHAAHGGKTVKGHSTSQHLDKGAKGYKTDEKHRKEYEEEGGKKHRHRDHADHKGQHAEEAHGHRGAHFNEKKGHKKGHKTKGYHNKYHKDEFHKEHKFYDDFHKSGEHHRYGKFHAKHDSNEGGKKKAHHMDAGHDFVEKGKKGYSNKGHVDADHKGYKGSHGHEEHHEKQEQHGKKGGGTGGKQWGYAKN